jgi:hypothetical protein
MFAGCESLKKIYGVLDFTSATNTVGMFNGCIDLEEVEIVIIACKPEKISSPFVEYGLTERVEKAIPKAIDMVYEEVII